jgi:hypothetical protein
MKRSLLTLMLAFIVSVSMAQKKTDTVDSPFKNDSKWQGLKPCDTCKTTATQFHGDTSQHWLLSTYTWPKCYNVNWSKVKTFKDLKALLQAMRIQFCLDEKQIKSIKKYLIETK